MKENWKDIKGYEGKYQVSNYGRVKSMARLNRSGARINEKILDPKPQRNGYVIVHLSGDDGYHRHLVHRLVAEAFCKKKNDTDNIVNHLDNNPSNNRSDNLEWTTYKGNMQWAAKQGRMKCNPSNLAKAQRAKRVPIIAIDTLGNKYRFDSQKDAEKALGVKASHIAAFCRKEYGYKQSKGYIFEYADAEYQKSLTPNKVKMTDEERTIFFSERMKGNQYGKGRRLSENSISTIKQKLGKTILQYDKEGNFIKEFSCAEDVVRELGISHSDDVANGKRKTAGGYVWRWKEIK